MSAPFLFVHGPGLDESAYPDDCPFNTSRAGKTAAKLRSMGLLSGSSVRVIAPEAATRDELERFHAPQYLDAIRRAERGEHDIHALAMGLGTGDCPVFKGMYDYAALTCGASLTAAREIVSTDARVAFNPSGGFHHAGPDCAAGFCYMNDLVLAINALTDAGKRVVFLDVDVHHGDGVQNAFYDRRDVMTVSLHQNGKTLFPGTGFEDEIGCGDGEGFAVNIPLPVGTYDEAYTAVFKRVAMPLISKFAPDVIVLELGMDALDSDPLARLQLTNNTYANVIRRVMHLEKPLLATGGGGYHVENTVRGWALAWAVMTDREEEDHGFALGGVMLENTDWVGGLRDRTLPVDADVRAEVDDELMPTVERLKALLFPRHGLEI